MPVNLLVDGFTMSSSAVNESLLTVNLKTTLSRLEGLSLYIVVSVFVGMQSFILAG